MHDLPSTTLLQQAHARPVTGEELEVFGKKAAATYACGTCGTLTDAVVETVKHAGLSPEQVKRVVELTNQNAYLEEFRKEGSPHKYIDFAGGPASPSEVLKDLNDGGGGTVFDRGVADYGNPPVKTAQLHMRNRAALGLEKTASADIFNPAEAAFEQMWRSADQPIPFADPFQESVAMREKLATMRDNLNSDLSSLEIDYMTIGDHLYSLVKQAALEGTPLGHIIQAWQDITPGEGYVKSAFQIVGPRLVEQEVFPSLDGVAESLTKTAAAQAMPNHEHPLLKTFAAFCTQLDKMASARVARDEVSTYYDRIDWFVKTGMRKEADWKSTLKGLAGKEGIIPKAWGQASQFIKGTAAPAAASAAKFIGGERAGKIVGKAVKYAPEALLYGGGALAAKEVYDRGIKYGPGQIGVRYLKSHVPGTREYYVRQYNLQQSMMPM